MRQLALSNPAANTDSEEGRTLLLELMSWYSVSVCPFAPSIRRISANYFPPATALLGQFAKILPSELADVRQQNSKFRHKSLDMPHSCSHSLEEDAVRCPLFFGCPSTRHLYCIVYIFIGSILLGDSITLKVFGSLVGFIGVAYAVLEFIPSIEPPQNMREADGGWGAETV